MNAMPPDAAFRGEAWLDEWRARLDTTPPWLVQWLRHQTDGPYWRPGSLAPDYDDVEAAIVDVGGWCDAYVDAAFRMQARCTAPSRTNRRQLGPTAGRMTPRPGRTSTSSTRSSGSSTVAQGGWERRRPRARPRLVRARLRRAGTLPGGMAGSLAGDDGVPASCDPRDGLGLRGWTRATNRRARHGRGHGRPCWGRPVPAPTDRRHARVAVVGRGRRAERPARDLRPDESLGRSYTTEPLGAPVSVLGEPVVVLHLAVVAPVATAVVRLSDIAPDGTSAWVSSGILNLTHRRSDKYPEPLIPDGSRRCASPSATPATGSHPGIGTRVAVASSAWPVDLALAVRCGLRAASRTGDAVAAHPPGRPRCRRPGWSACPGVQTTPPDVRAVVGRARPPTSPAGGSRRTSSPARRRSPSTTAARTS